MDIFEAKEIINEIKSDVKEIKDKLYTIDVTMVRNTLSLEEHMAQTKLLRDMVLPLHREKIERDAVVEYKTKKEFEYQRKKDYFYNKLKIPTFIISVIVAISTILKMLGKI